MLQVAVADSVETDAPPGEATVELDVPSRQVSAAVSVTEAAPVFVAFSLQPDGKITHQISSEPFRTCNGALRWPPTSAGPPTYTC